MTWEDDVWFMARDLHQDYGRRHIHKESREAMIVYLSNRLNGSKPLWRHHGANTRSTWCGGLLVRSVFVDIFN